MGQAYTPGLKVTTDTLLKRRVLPLRGEVMVQANTTVKAQDVVARAELPGDIMPINMANRLSVPPGDVRSLLQVEQGMQITKGDVLAETKGILFDEVESAQRPLCRGEHFGHHRPVDFAGPSTPWKSWPTCRAKPGSARWRRGGHRESGGFDPRHLWDRW